MLQTTEKKSETSSSRSNVLDLAGSKLRKKLGSSLQESAAAPASDFAYKQLEKMGWSEGTGLGKRRDGIKTHIRVKKREEQAGLGTEKAAVQQAAAGEQWWKDSLGDTLAKIGKKKKGSSKKTSKKRKKEYTDEELFEATGGARFGMRAAPTQKLAKWRRTESMASDATPSRAISPDEVPRVEGNSQKDGSEEISVRKRDKKKSKKEKKAKKENKSSSKRKKRDE